MAVVVVSIEIMEVLSDLSRICHSTSGALLWQTRCTGTCPCRMHRAFRVLKEQNYLEHIRTVRIIGKKTKSALNFHHFLITPNGWKSSQVNGEYHSMSGSCWLRSGICFPSTAIRNATCQRLKALSARWFSLELSREVGLNSIWLKNMQIWRRSELHPLFDWLTSWILVLYCFCSWLLDSNRPSSWSSTSLLRFASVT